MDWAVVAGVVIRWIKNSQTRRSRIVLISLVRANYLSRRSVTEFPWLRVSRVCLREDAFHVLVGDGNARRAFYPYLSLAFFVFLFFYFFFYEF